MTTLTPADFNTMRFICSAPNARAFPAPEGCEIAFAGRSNAGKSSALNAICTRTGLARTSKTPGRTQAINFFDNGHIRFADLPGYGFARVPPAVKAAWQALIEGYLRERATLGGVVLIMDSRRPLLAFDQQLMGWGMEIGLRFHLLLTKADKLSRNQQVNTLRAVQREMPDASAQLFSATRRIGIDDARGAIARLATPSEADSDM